MKKAVLAVLVSLVGAFLTTPAGADTIAGTLLQVSGKDSTGTLLVMTGSKVRRITLDASTVVTRGETNPYPAVAARSDLQAGDHVTVELDPGGVAKSVAAEYTLTQGRLRTILRRSLLLEDGRLMDVNPNVKVLTESGSAVFYSVIRRGDYVTLKLNPISGEVWRIVLSDEAAPLAIDSIVHDATLPLGTGDTLTVTMEGTPACRATFSIAGVVSYVEMTEVTPGKYTGTFMVTADTVPARSAAVVSRLSRGKQTVGPIQASSLITIENYRSVTIAERVAGSTRRDPRGAGAGRASRPRPTAVAIHADPKDPEAITILRPTQGSKAHDPLIIVGRARPNCKLRVTVTYSNNMAGLLRLAGTLCTEVLTADSQGGFRSNPIRLPQVYAGKDLDITVKIETLGEKPARKAVVVRVKR